MILAAIAFAACVIALAVVSFGAGHFTGWMSGREDMLRELLE